MRRGYVPSGRYGVAAFLLLASCRDPVPVQVRAHLSPGVPLADLQVIAVPFSPRSLLDSLEQAATRPRPRFDELEERLRSFTPGKDTGEPDTGVTIAWLATRDSVNRLADRLRGMDRSTQAYREAYNRFRELYGRYTARASARDAAIRSLLAEDRALAQRASRAADSLREWEREAYRDFPQLADERVRQSGREVERVSTDSTGRAIVELGRGDWWLNASYTDPANPFIEYRWSVPVTIAGLPFGVPITRANAGGGWRH